MDDGAGTKKPKSMGARVESPLYGFEYAHALFQFHLFLSFQVTHQNNRRIKSACERENEKRSVLESRTTYLGSSGIQIECSADSRQQNKRRWLFFTSMLLEELASMFCFRPR